MKTKLLILLSAIFLFAGCHKRKAEQTTVQNDTKNKKLIMAELPATESSPVTVDSMRVQDQTLILNVSYSGGCEEHSFDLYFNGMYAKSLPVQANLQLYHQGNGDACRKLEMKELKFDISEMKPPGGNSIVLKLAGLQATYNIK
jgi:hypothetical protein